jgi:hypothetical protein
MVNETLASIQTWKKDKIEIFMGFILNQLLSDSAKDILYGADTSQAHEQVNLASPTPYAIYACKLAIAASWSIEK